MDGSQVFFLFGIVALVLGATAVGVNTEKLGSTLLLFRLFTHDGLCIFPRQPVSWALSILPNRFFKFTRVNFLYPYISIFFDGEFTPTLLFAIYLSMSLRTKKLEVTGNGKMKGRRRKTRWEWILWFTLFVASPLACLHRYYVLHEFRSHYYKVYGLEDHDTLEASHVFSFTHSISNSFGKSSM